MRKDMDEDIKKYEAILEMEHHVSKRHPRMPMKDRAAQFAPFAALKSNVLEEDKKEDPDRGSRT